MQHSPAANTFSIEISRVNSRELGVPVAQGRSHYQREARVPGDLHPKERRILDEGNQSTTKPTDDAGKSGSGALARRRFRRDKDFDDFMTNLPKGAAELAARPGVDDTQRRARRRLMETY